MKICVTLVAAAVAGNRHDVGLQAVADFFERDGWRVVLLGADMPAGDLAQALDFFEADVLGLSVSLGAQLAAAHEAIATVRAGGRGAACKILLGGAALAGSEDLAVRLGADACAAGPAEAVAWANRFA